MRVTTQQLHRTSLQAVNDARSRMTETQQVAMTGKRVATASDDPAAAARARMLEDLQATASAHRSNASFGTSRLQATDDALNEVSRQIQRAREVALAMASDSMNAEQRNAAAAEIGEVRSTVVDLINTQHLGEYIFAPVDTHTPPYDSAGGTFSYDVDTFQDVRRVDVGPAQQAEIGASGSRAFAQRAGSPTSIDVPTVLADLRASLESNDRDAIRAEIDNISRAFDQVLAERTRAGVRMERLTDAKQASEQSLAVYASLESDLVDADAAEAFSQLSLAQTTMQAAVTVAARMLGPTLLDVL